MRHIRYSDDVETIRADEDETADRIIAAMAEGGDVTRERYDRSVRTSHAKAHGLLHGGLVVSSRLAPELRQGLFAEPRHYPVIVRLPLKHLRQGGRRPEIAVPRDGQSASRSEGSP